MLLPACISVMASILSAVLRTVTLFLLEMARIAPMSRRRAKCIVSIAGVGRGCRSASHRWDRADTKKAKLQTVLHAEVFFDPQRTRTGAFDSLLSSRESTRPCGMWRIGSD